MKRVETGASRPFPNSQMQAPRQDLEEHPSPAVSRDEKADAYGSYQQNPDPTSA